MTNRVSHDYYPRRYDYCLLIYICDLGETA